MVRRFVQPPLMDALDQVQVQDVCHGQSHAKIEEEDKGLAYEPISVCGRGAFGTVMLAKWHGTLRLLPPSDPSAGTSSAWSTSTQKDDRMRSSVGLGT